MALEHVLTHVNLPLTKGLKSLGACNSHAVGLWLTNLMVRGFKTLSKLGFKSIHADSLEQRVGRIVAEALRSDTSRCLVRLAF
jgi:hypothetical protein